MLVALCHYHLNWCNEEGWLFSFSSCGGWKIHALRATEIGSIVLCVYNYVMPFCLSYRYNTSTIQDNLELEHKYNRTKLWMEYVGNDADQPVPFNLLPSPADVKKIISYARKFLRREKTSPQTHVSEGPIYFSTVKNLDLVV